MREVTTKDPGQSSKARKRPFKPELLSVKDARKVTFAWVLAYFVVGFVLLDGHFTHFVSHAQDLFTMIHEMGHGLVAEILGGDLLEIVIHDRGGYASSTRSSEFDGGLIAGAGLLMAPFLGMILSWTMLFPFLQRLAWFILGAGTFLWAFPACRSLEATISSLVIVGICGILVVIRSKFLRQFLNALMVSSMFASAFVSKDYLFASMTGLVPENGDADVQAMANSLGGSALMWSIVLLFCIGFFALLSLMSVYVALKRAVDDD